LPLKLSSYSSGVAEVCRELFGDKCEEIAERWCIERSDTSITRAMPRGRVANVFIVVEAQSMLLIRHESDHPDSVDIMTVYGKPVPAITGTKMHAVFRRTMLSILHDWYDRNRELARDGEKGVWRESREYDCAMRPFIKERSSERKGEYFSGYCGMCPNCLIFGFAGMGSVGFNVKSRVEEDLYVGTAFSDKVIEERTFNAVDDILKTTEMPGTETGALFTLRLVSAGTLFVGKPVLRDMTLAELLLTLITISRTSRVGGRQTVFGKIAIHIPAILFTSFEVGSGYEIAMEVLKRVGEKRLASLDDVKKVIRDYVSRYSSSGILVTDDDLAEKLRKLSQSRVDDIVLEAWRDVLKFREALEKFALERA